MERHILSLSANDELTAIESTAGIQWEEKDEEFSLHGEMYDIVRSDTIAGTVTYYCVNDKKEAELIKNYNDHLRNNTPAKKIKSENIPLLFCEDLTSDTDANNFYNTQFSLNFYIIIQRHSSIISPPPEV